MQQSIIHVALVVKDYDEAIAFFCGKLHFDLVEDTYQPEQNKRWDGEEGHLAYAAGEKLGRSLQGAARYADAAVVFATTISDGEKSGRQVTQLLTLDALLADLPSRSGRARDRVPGRRPVTARCRITAGIGLSAVTVTGRGTATVPGAAPGSPGW